MRAVLGISWSAQAAETGTLDTLREWATFAAAVAAVLVAFRVYLVERRRDEYRDLLEHRRQASEIILSLSFSSQSASFDDELEPETMISFKVDNTSGAPIYDVAAVWRAATGQVRGADRIIFDILPNEDSRTHTATAPNLLNYGNALARFFGVPAGQINRNALGIAFTDYQGLRWTRIGKELTSPDLVRKGTMDPLRRPWVPYTELRRARTAQAAAISFSETLAELAASLQSPLEGSLEVAAEKRRRRRTRRSRQLVLLLIVILVLVAATLSGARSG